MPSPQSLALLNNNGFQLQGNAWVNHQNGAVLSAADVEMAERKGGAPVLNQMMAHAVQNATSNRPAPIEKPEVPQAPKPSEMEALARSAEQEVRAQFPPLTPEPSRYAPPPIAAPTPPITPVPEPVAEEAAPPEPTEEGSTERPRDEAMQQSPAAGNIEVTTESLDTEEAEEEVPEKPRHEGEKELWSAREDILRSAGFVKRTSGPVHWAHRGNSNCVFAAATVKSYPGDLEAFAKYVEKVKQQYRLG